MTERTIQFTFYGQRYLLDVDAAWPMDQVAEACAFRAGAPFGPIYELVPIEGGYLLSRAGSLSDEDKAALAPVPPVPEPEPVDALLAVAERMAQDLRSYADADKSDPYGVMMTLGLLDEFEQLRAALGSINQQQQEQSPC